MIGAIIGDIAGSTFEFHSVKTKDIPIFAPKSGYTDDSLMTIAVAKAIMAGQSYGVLDNADKMCGAFTYWMQYIGRSYPTQRGGYGTSFKAWLNSDKLEPYGSFGNGSAMRVSPCAYAGNTLKQVLDISRWSAEVSHNHPEGIKGAEAIAGCIYLARTGLSKDVIRSFVDNSYYKLDFTLDDIRPTYKFDVSCQGSVPQAIEAFLESTSFEDAIKNAISIGGDSDTIADMAGAIAWPFYKKNGGVTDTMRLEYKMARNMLNEDLETIVVDFMEKFDQ